MKMRVDKKMLGIGICLMMVGLAMFFGGMQLPDDTIDARSIQVMCMLIGLLAVFMCGLGLVILSYVEKENPTKR